MLPKPQFDQLLTLIPLLSNSQVIQVKDHLSLLHTTNLTKSSWLLEGAHAELRRRGLMGRSSSFPPKVLKSFDKDYQLKLMEAERFLEEQIGSKMTPPEKLRIASIAIETLCDMLLENGRTPSLRMVVVNLQNIPLALDWAFPGYAAAGLLGMVVRQNNKCL